MSMIEIKEESIDENYIKLNWDLVENICMQKYNHLKRIAYRRLYNMQMAEDAVQDTMESICINVTKQNKMVN